MFKLESKHQKEQRIIKNIHDDFDSAQDRLLAQARKFLEEIKIEDTTDQDDLAKRFEKIGFNNVPIVKQLSSLKKDIAIKQDQIVKTKQEAELIEYYKLNYPFLKFLTESELDRICTKYGLVYAPVGNYIESVPEKNLIEIEQAQLLKKADLCPDDYFLKIHSWWPSCPLYIRHLLSGDVKWTKGKSCTDSLCLELARDLGYKGAYNGYIFGISGATLTKLEKDGLFIAAPPSHFNTKGLKKKGLGFFEFTKTEIKDPIVYRYVKGGIQVLSKWGLEASDPMLLNPINN